MKVQRWINVLVALNIVFLSWGQYIPQREVVVAIDFTASTTNQGVVFGDVSVLKSLTNKTICASVNAESFGTFNTIFHINHSAVGATLKGYALLLSTGKIRFAVGWTGSTAEVAYWDSDAALSLSTNYRICVTYNNSSTANDPIFYVNGASVALTEVGAPVGTVIDSGGTTKIGGYGIASGSPFDGLVGNAMVYNRIFSAAEALEDYASRGASHNDYGLVFHAPCISAAGIQTFDGATLTATSYIYDRISGLKGTPAGNPVGVADTVLTYVDDH